MKRHYLFIIFYLFQSISTHGQINLLEYLNISIAKKPDSKMLLREVYTIEKSKGSQFKRKYLSTREEFDRKGRPFLSISYDPQGEMLSKVIMFYPSPFTEKNIFQQRNGFLDSALYHYSTEGMRLKETWYWEQNQSSDTIDYSYNNAGKIVKIHKKYDWATRWDTLHYKGNLLLRAITYNGETEIQKEVTFVYDFDSLLIKANKLNRKRLVVEEEFFFYNRRGQIEKSITKFYPEGDEIIDPPRMVSKNKYHSNGNIKKTSKVYFSMDRKTRVSTSKILYDRKGRLTKRIDKSKREGIFKITLINYTSRKR